jgi:hypothetical protein
MHTKFWSEYLREKDHLVSTKRRLVYKIKVDIKETKCEVVD